MKNILKAIIFATIFMSISQTVSAAPPANDYWQNPQILTGEMGEMAGSTVEATAQMCEPTHVFPDMAPRAAASSVWYGWTAPASASYTFTVSSMQEASISAYVLAPGTCNGGVAQIPYRLTENDAYEVTTAQPTTISRITFPVTAGATIFFSVDSLNNPRTSFTLSWGKTRYRYSAQLDTRDPGTDVIIKRETGGATEWWFRRSASQGFTRHGAVQFGRFNDKKLMGDFDGDGLTDLAVMRPENGNLTWWVMSYTGQVLKVVVFGLETDRPIIGDYDGDGRADIAVTRDEANGQKVWHFLRSSNGSYGNLQFGLATDTEMIGDYDGDGKTDVVVLRFNAGDYTWYILRSSDGAIQSKVFGRGGDRPQVADFDRDGKSDLVMFRRDSVYDPDTTDGNWYIINSSTPDQVVVKRFGVKHDTPQLGDFDGDGIPDLTIFRDQSVWWSERSTYGVTSFAFGQHNDAPMTDLGVCGAFSTF